MSGTAYRGRCVLATSAAFFHLVVERSRWTSVRTAIPTPNGSNQGLPMRADSPDCPTANAAASPSKREETGIQLNPLIKVPRTNTAIAQQNMKAVVPIAIGRTDRG